MNYEVKNYLESLGARYNHAGCSKNPNGEWILKTNKYELHIPREALEGGYFENKLTNPMTLENLKESIIYCENDNNS